MKKLQGGKITALLLALVTALALVTWSFLSFKNGILAASPGKNDSNEQEIKVKILDKEPETSGPEKSREETAKDFQLKSKGLAAKEHDDIMKEFEETQHEMEALMDEMRNSQARMMRDIMKDFDDDDIFTLKNQLKSIPDDDFMKRDDWDITPRSGTDPSLLLTDPDSQEFWSKFLDSQGLKNQPSSMSDLTGLSTTLDVHDYKDRFVVKCDLPGMDKENIQLTLKGRQLTIAGSRDAAVEQTKEENGGKTIISERSFGEFSRSITLPENIEPDKITSKYTNGVLEIIVPKVHVEESEEKKIIVQ